MKKISKILLLIVLFTLAGGVIAEKPVLAAPLQPDPGSTIPTSIHDYLTGCSANYAATKQSPAFSYWVTKAGDKTTTSLTVPAGTTFVDLQFNFSGAYCTDNSSDLETRTYVENAVTPGISGLVGQQSVLFFPGPGPGRDGAYAGTTNTFIYTPQGGFLPGTNSYTLIFNKQTINRFKSGNYICVGDNQDAGGSFNFGKCTSYSSSYTIQVTVTKVSWSLAGVSTVSAPSAVPGTPVTFNHVVSNAGPATATPVNTQVHTSYNGVPGTLSAVTTTISKGSNFKTSNIFTPKVSDIGKIFCQNIDFGPASGPMTAGKASKAACVVIVSKPQPPPSSVSCPNLPGVDISKVGVSLPSSELSFPPPNSPPKKGDTYATRITIGQTILTANDSNTGAPLSFDDASKTVNFTSSVVNYPYDSQAANLSYTNTYIGTTYVYNGKTWSSTSATNVSKVRFDGSASIGECYLRHFDVGPISASAPTLAPDTEQPTSANVVGATAIVTFSYTGPTPTGGMRSPMKVTLNYTSSCASPSSGTVVVTGNLMAGPATANIPGGSCGLPPLILGAQACANFGLSPQQGDIEGNGTQKPAGSGSVSPPPFCSTPISNRPYVHFFGEDVSAGGTFAKLDDKCVGAAVPAGGAISAFVKGGPLTQGSGSQYAVLALGPIPTNSATKAGFGSAGLRNPTAPTSLSGLTFANTPAGALGSLSNTHCAPDYFSTKPAALTQTSGDLNMAPFDGNGNKVAQQLWYSNPASGTTTIKGFVGPLQGIADKNRIAVYVTGDVYIDNDIRYKNIDWTDPDDIPSFYLVASGDIYVSGNVKQLDGVYIAQQKSGGAGGTIYTCAPGFSQYSGLQLLANCSKQLIVNGSFIANKVVLNRTFSSLRNSSGGESPLSPAPAGSCIAGGAPANSYDCAAEVFNFTPELFINQPPIGPVNQKGQQKFDAINSLSPVL